MRFRLRTLLILMAIMPPIFAWTWFTWHWLDDVTPRSLLKRGGGATLYVDDPARWP